MDITLYIKHLEQMRKKWAFGMEMLGRTPALFGRRGRTAWRRIALRCRSAPLAERLHIPR